MTQDKIYEGLNEVFRDVFDDSSINVNETTTAENVEEWDSLEHINLILAVEKYFGMKFTMAEVTGMKDVGEMATIISERTTK